MRTPWTAALPALILFPLLLAPGCGDSNDTDALFGPTSATPATGGSGGGDASTGGTGGSNPTGGNGGTTPAGGYGGSTGGDGGSSQVGGYGGSTPSGGFGGTGDTGGFGGSTPSGGFGGTGQTGGFGGSSPVGGSGGGPTPLGDVPCPSANPSDSCQVPNQVCCLTFANNDTGSCIAGNQAGTCETDIQCDAPSHCPANLYCCGHLVNWNGTRRYDGVRCQQTCSGADEVVFCDPWDNTVSCTNGEYCDASSILPDGYYVCK